MSLLLAPLAMCAFCSTPAFSSPQLIFYCTKLKSVRTWIVRSPLGFSFIYPPSWSVSDRRPFTSIYFAVVSPSLGSCFAISFLPPLISHLFFGACLSNASFCNLHLLFLQSGSYLPPSGFRCSVSSFLISILPPPLDLHTVERTPTLRIYSRLQPLNFQGQDQ